MNKTLTSSPRQKIENKNEITNFSLSCINCGCREEIHLIAHRNKDKYICGFIAICGDCSRLLEKEERYIRLEID